MLDARKTHYDELDSLAKSIAGMDINGTAMSEAILAVVIELYKSAKVEELFKDDKFESAYHSPITSELEFIVARILYHYSQTNEKGWKVLLRRQVGKTAPVVSNILCKRPSLHSLSSGCGNRGPGSHSRAVFSRPAFGLRK